MPDGKRGAEEPIQEQVRAEHRRMYGLLRDVREAFQHPDHPAGVRDTFAVLRREFEDHFDQEDRVYYRPIAEQHPELKPTLDAFSEEHGRLRRELAAIGERLDRGDLEGASPAVLEMALAFERHESAEEEFLLRLDPFSTDD
jgi:iron-sulfur cluster repair protein YtfE (RIC family)